MNRLEEAVLSDPRIYRGMEPPDEALVACVEDLELRGLLLDNVPDGIAALTLEGDLIYANTMAESLWGASSNEVRARGSWGWIPPASRTQALSCIDGLTHDGTPCSFELAVIRLDGTFAHQEVVARIAHGSSGPIIVAAIRDVSERVRADMTVRHLAFHDQLTGLGNRVMLHRDLSAAIAEAERHGDHLGVIFIDLDDFKPVNDRFGHHVGDSVLIEVGRRIVGAVRTYDTVARLGGDEFVVVVPRLSAPEDLESVSRQVTAAISAPITLASAEICVSASVGLTIYRHGDTAGELLTRADLQMYDQRRAVPRENDIQAV